MCSLSLQHNITNNVRPSPSQTTATSSVGRNPARRSPVRRPARDPRGSLSAMTPMRSTPWSDVLTTRGHRHRILGLPVSDEDEEELANTLRAAAEDDSTLRIVNVAALDSETAPSMRSLLRMQHRILGGTRRLFRAASTAGTTQPHLGGDPRRATSHRCGHRVTGSELPLGIRSRRSAGASARVGRTGRPVTRQGKRSRRMVSVHQPDHGAAATPPSGKTRSRCAIKRSTFPGWFGGLRRRAAHRCNCTMTQRIW